MKFGVLPLEVCAGSLLAHRIVVAGLSLGKGHLLTAADVAHLARAGITELTVAQMSADDCPEDDAANALAQALCGPCIHAHPASTGRANLYAGAAGLALLDVERINALNCLHEGLTLATLSAFARVEQGALVATIKIIPFALPRAMIEQAAALLEGHDSIVAVAPFRAHKAGLIVTAMAGSKASLVQKSFASLRARLESLGSVVACEAVVPHDSAAIAQALIGQRAQGATPLLIFGATAIADRADVVPQGLVRAGGQIDHLGMPVDPGNLLMWGNLHGSPVIGVPTCARSIAANGFDLVLQRVLAGLPVSSAIISGLGVGGLLAEIATRPSPREKPLGSSVAGVVLAAGLSRRMGRQNKLLAPFRGKPLVWHMVSALVAADIHPVIVVTGHEARAVEAALAGLDVIFTHNADYASGMGPSLSLGIAAVPEACDGALVALGDMPLVKPQTLTSLVEAFGRGKAGIVAPVHEGKRGHPVLWGRRYFNALKTLAGDDGARAVLQMHLDDLYMEDISDAGIHEDCDDAEALARLAGQAD